MVGEEEEEERENAPSTPFLSGKVGPDSAHLAVAHHQDLIDYGLITQ